MPANLRPHSNLPVGTNEQPVLYMAFELGWDSWKLAFATGPGPAPRQREMPARDVPRLMLEIAEAKRRLRLPADCPVVSCYEAGRDSFWLHRCLAAHGVQNLIVDSASIEVNRRQRRAKSDNLDVGKLLSMLLRYAGGETKVWSVVQVPTPEEEDARQLHRELITLSRQATQHTNRIKALFAGFGLTIEVDRHFPRKLKELRQWDGTPVPKALQQRLLCEFERLQVVNRQARRLQQQRVKEVRVKKSPAVQQVRKLLGLKGIGIGSSWLYVHEFFAWRKFKNRKEVGSLAGLTPTPYASGQIDHEQGISKAGNKLMRWMAVEIAWNWLRYQPDSELSRWFYTRFGRGSSRQRRIGIVALARKLLVQLWKYLETSVPPAGAQLADWRTKTRITSANLSTG
ncbi:MAG TPA: IS110 family transposase [Bryobacteraceae bacterium]|nr:IS110 family transposase [Bryobacteraceae bacterium]